MDFPYSIYVWHAPRRLTDKPFWQEELRANNQQMAIYAAGLLYQAGVPHGEAVRERPVVKVVRFGIALHCFPDEHTVELCEKQIARYNEHPYEPRRPFGAEQAILWVLAGFISPGCLLPSWPKALSESRLGALLVLSRGLE